MVRGWSSCIGVWISLGASGCVSTPPQRSIWVDPTTRVQAFDADGIPTDPAPSFAEVAARGPFGAPPAPDLVAEVEAALRSARESSAMADVVPIDGDEGVGAPQDPQPDTDAARRQREAMIRATFGDAVSIGADGTLTKMYQVSNLTGQTFVSLTKPWDPSDARSLDAAGGGGNASFGGEGPNTTVLDRLLGIEHSVDIVYIKDFGTVTNFTVPKNPADIAQPTGQIDKGALMIVTAKPSALAAFERALDLFYVNIPQIEIEVKVVEYTTTDSLNFGVANTGASGSPIPTFNNLSSGKLIENITSDFPITAPFIGASSITDSGLIRLGGIHDSWELDAILQALETNAVADILSQPKLVVRNGGMATVQTSTSLPFPKARISTTGNVVESQVEFKEVGIVMTIKPEVAGTDTVTLLVHASVSAATGFAGTTPIPTPIISTRAATTSVHLREGETMVIGGLVSNATLESESKIPLLGDIPILGYLFRSTSKQVQKTVLEFWITPTIVRASGF